MNTKTRRLLIEERIADQGELNFAELAAEFGVSEMTIRRDLEEFERLGLVRKIMGGVIAVGGKAYEPPFTSRMNIAAGQKEQLAEAVVGLIKPSQTLILDSGSTMLSVAKSLRGKKLGLTVITPSVLAAVELADESDIRVILTGGTLRPGELSLIGSETERSLQQYNCDLYLMGVAALDAAHGATEYHLEEASVKRTAMRSADRTIVVADRRKLGRTQLRSVAALSELHTLVTNAPKEHPVVTAAAEQGVELVLVPANNTP